MSSEFFAVADGDSMEAAWVRIGMKDRTFVRISDSVADVAARLRKAGKPVGILRAAAQHTPYDVAMEMAHALLDLNDPRIGAYDGTKYGVVGGIQYGTRGFVFFGMDRWCG